MKIRIYTLGTGESAASADIDKRLENLFADYTDPSERITSFPSLKDSLVSAGKAFKENEVIMFFPDISIYGETKRLFTQAFGFKLVYDDAILARAQASLQSCEKGSEESKIHASVPENGVALSLCDGLYSGFIISSGRQTVVFAPYEKERTMWLVNEQVLPYLNERYGAGLSALTDVKFRAQRLCNALSDRSLAVAGTAAAGLVQNETSQCEQLDEAVKYLPKAEHRGGLAPVEYSVNISIAASELAGCEYGAAITNAFYTGEDESSEKCVYLAVSNDIETRVREIHSVSGEDADGFVGRCASALVDFVAEIAENDSLRLSAASGKKHLRKSG